MYDPTDDAHRHEEEPSSLSLLGGVAKLDELSDGVDLDLDAMQASRRRVSQGTMILLLAVVVAVGAIYAMRLGQGNLTAGGVSSDVMKKIEAALARSGPQTATAAGVSADMGQMRSSFRDTQSIISLFNADVSQRQVPINYVQKNPFALPQEPQVVQLDDPDAAARADAGRLREQLHRLEAELQRLKLQSVMANARIPVVVIDGQFYKTGQPVGSFTITRIHDRGVDLQAMGRTFQLTMEESTSPPSRGGRR